MGRFVRPLVFTGCLISFLAHAGLDIGSAPPPITAAKILQAPASASLDWKVLRGKVVVVDFWATWCGPCVAAMPHWNKLVDAFADKPVQFVAVTDENVDVVQTFLQHTTIHSWVSVDDSYHSTRDLYGIEGIPTTIIVNQLGVVVAITHPESVEPKHLEEVLQTQKSSLPRPQRNHTADESTTNTVTFPKPVFEVLVRNSDPHPGHGRGVDFWSRWNNDGEITGQWASVRRAIIALFASRETLLDCRTELPHDDYNHDFTIRLPGVTADERDKIIAFDVSRHVPGSKFIANSPSATFSS